MGASHSNQPRSVSMDNPNGVGVIDVSDDVVKRLKLNVKKQVKDSVSAEEAPTSQTSQRQQQKETRAVPVQSSPKISVAAETITPLPHAPPIVYQNPTPVYTPTPVGTTMTALDVRRQKEIELQQNDAMWRQRMSQLEAMLKKTNSIMENEYSTAVEDVRKRFENAAPVHQLPPCQDLKAKVIACYKQNPGETLNCADEVAQFRYCVCANRVKRLDEAEKESKTAVVPVAEEKTSVKPAKAKAA